MPTFSFAAVARKGQRRERSNDVAPALDGAVARLETPDAQHHRAVDAVRVHRSQQIVGPIAASAMPRRADMRMRVEDAKSILHGSAETIVSVISVVVASEEDVRSAVIRALAGRVPILGVCLGHQSVGAAFGGTIIRAPSLMHGKTSRINHTGRGIFRGLNSGFEATANSCFERLRTMAPGVMARLDAARS